MSQTAAFPSERTPPTLKASSRTNLMPCRPRRVRSTVLLPSQWKNRSMRLGTTRSLFKGSGWRVTSPTSLPSTPSTRSPSFPTPAAPTRPRLRSSAAVGAHGRVAHHRNRPHRHRGDPAAVGRAAGACYHRDPGGLQTLGPDPIPTPLAAAISCFVTLRRGRQLVYERNMIDKLALKLVHGSYQ